MIDRPKIVDAIGPKGRCWAKMSNPKADEPGNLATRRKSVNGDCGLAEDFC